jgi:ribokinase
MRSPDVLAVGEVMVDVSVPPEAVGAGHVVGRIAMRAGGSSATAAVWAARAGARAAVVGRVGADFAGEAIRQALRTRSVDPLLATDEEASTGIVLMLGGEVLADRGANARLAPADVPERIDAPAVLVSGYVLLHEDTRAAGRAALERAKGPWVAVDAASARLVAAAGRRGFQALTEAATVLVLNDDEAAALTGERGEAAARALAESFLLVCVKQGARGALALNEGRLERVEASAAPGMAQDGTGAGDAFAGALLAALTQGRDVAEALARACAAGAAALQSPTGWPPT